MNDAGIAATNVAQPSTGAGGSAGGAPRAQDERGFTATLASRVLSISYASLPAAIVERTKDLILDHLGVALFGIASPTTLAVRSVFAGDTLPAQSTIYLGGIASARAAAFCNAAAGHASEFDDTHDESLNHPGAVVIPTALAVAEAHDRTIGEFLAAVVAGYEAQCRIGRAFGVALIRRGFHPTATCGVYGATAAAARLIGLDARGIESAFGSATSMAGGVMQFTDDSEGAEIKRLHAAVGADRGITAALLHQAGLVGPRRAIEGRYGFARVLAGIEVAPPMPADDAYEIERISIKLYPCCKLFHSLVEAIERCRDRGMIAGDALKAIASIEPFGPLAMIEGHMERRPRSTMAAQYSLPFTTAVALASDPGDPRSFDEASRSDPALLRLADLVEPAVDGAMEATFPAKFAGGIRIRCRDGSVIEDAVFDAKSSPDRPIGREDVVAKFVRLTSSVVDSTRQMQLIDAVTMAKPQSPVRQLTQLLRG